MQHSLPKFYRNFAIVFLAGAVILFAAFFYFMLSKAVITIKPTYQDINANMIVDIKDLPFESPIEDDGFIPGKIFDFDLQEQKRYDTTGQKDIVSDVVGKVKVINNYSKEQTLVETTRLLTEDGVLLRMKEGIVIRPGETIEVTVYPDDEDSFTNIAPTRFVIPGLWEPIQEYIYAQSDTELTKGGFKVKVFSQKDADDAVADLTKILEQKATDEFKKLLTEKETFFTRLVQKEVTLQEFDAVVGEEKESFTLDMKMDVAVIAFDEIKLVNLVKRNLLQNMTEGKALKDFDANNLNYSVQKYDAESKIANVKVSGVGKSTIRVSSSILDTSFLAGLSQQEARDWLLKYPEIEDVTITLSPAWATKLPRFAERIEVVVE